MMDYKPEINFSCFNRRTMIVFTNEQVGTMAEEICGEVVRSDFEDIKCWSDLMHPRDNGCSSDKDGNSRDNDNIKELYICRSSSVRRVWNV